MKFDYQSRLPKEDVRARLEALGDYLKNRHKIVPTWSGDSATIAGKYMMVKIEGKLTIGDGVVKFEGKDPGRLLRGQAIAYLQRKLDAYLDPKTPVDKLPRGK